VVDSAPDVEGDKDSVS
jgi:hypothetical protein